VKADKTPADQRRLDFAKRLTQYVAESGFSRGEIADRAGLDRSLLIHYTGGRSIPTKANLEALAKALDIAPEDLLPYEAPVSSDTDTDTDTIDAPAPSPKYRTRTAPTTPALTPSHLSKQEFARRLTQLMLAKGWNQSELGRRAGLNRDAISTYVNAKSLPSPLNVQALADALGVMPEELLPNITEAAMDEPHPGFELKSSSASPGRAWIRVNRLVTMATAIKIGELLERDRVLDRE